MKKQKRWFHFLFILVWPLVKIFYPCRYYGVENVPDGPCIICPSHSNLPDPFFITLAMGWDGFIHHLAKDDTRNIPFLGFVMEKMGSIFVHRGEQDIEAYKQCIRVLQSGEKLMVFPEGTRVHGNDVVPAKSGVIRMAAKTRSPIVPVYLPRDKKLFHRIDIVFGEAYYIENAGHADYEPLAQDLMDRIWALKGTL